MAWFKCLTSSPQLRSNREIGQVMDYNNVTAVKESHFNASFPTMLIIHGFGSSCSRTWAREMRVAFLATVIIVFDPK